MRFVRNLQIKLVNRILMGICTNKTSTTTYECHELTKKETKNSKLISKRSLNRRHDSISLEFDGYSRKSSKSHIKRRSSSLCKLSADFFAIWGKDSKIGQNCGDEKRVLTLGSEVTISALAARGLAYTCKKGKKADLHNQDNFHIYSDSKTLLLAVFDGHGPHGHTISAFASKTLPKHITTSKSRTSNPLDAIKSAFRHTELDLERHCSLRSNKIDCEMSGTTATVVLVEPSTLYIGFVGDSSVVLGTLKGKRHVAVKLTVDHKPTLPKEMKRIKAAGGEVRRISENTPYRVFQQGEDFPGLAMSRALGDLHAQRLGVSASAELIEHTIRPDNEFVIVASDGLWDFVSIQEAVDNVSMYGRTGARIAAESLSKLALSRWSKIDNGQSIDDITILVAYIQPN